GPTRPPRVAGPVPRGAGPPPPRGRRRPPRARPRRPPRSAMRCVEAGSCSPCSRASSDGAARGPSVRGGGRELPELDARLDLVARVGELVEDALEALLGLVGTLGLDQAAGGGAQHLTARLAVDLAHELVEVRGRLGVLPEALLGVAEAPAHRVREQARAALLEVRLVVVDRALP